MEMIPKEQYDRLVQDMSSFNLCLCALVLKYGAKVEHDEIIQGFQVNGSYEYDLGLADFERVLGAQVLLQNEMVNDDPVTRVILIPAIRDGEESGKEA